jgi:AraC-like DNA-binding protein
MNDSSSNPAVRLPAPPLRPFISHYAAMRAQGLPPGTHAGLPSRHVHLIVNLAGPIEILRMPSAAQRPAALAAFVTGIQDAPAMVRQGGDVDGLHVFLKPHGVRAILGVASAELTCRVFPLADLWGPAAGRLIERLRNAGSGEQRFSILDHTFLRALNPVSPPGAWAWAWRRLVETHGGLPIHQLARELAFSRRHFGERFHAEFGVPPKTAARIFRFEHACRVMKDQRPGLAEVAFASGFHDQAHMTREWNSLAGCTPKTWIAQELPILQDYELAGGDDREDEGAQHETESACRSKFQRPVRGRVQVL